MNYLGTWNFSHIRGTILEVRQMSETHISGGGTDANGNSRAIRSSTTHFNKCRIKQSDGTEVFYNLRCDYSIGDEVEVVFVNDKVVGDVNSTTHEYITKPTFVNPNEKFIVPVLIGSIILGAFTVLILIGIPIIIAGIVYAMKVNKEYVKLYREEIFGKGIDDDDEKKKIKAETVEIK
jgi:hypothetical protein